MVPIDVILSLARFTLGSKFSYPNESIYDVEALEEKRYNVQNK